MNYTAALAGLGLALAATLAVAQDLPDLGGREVVVVTENAYPPLQFLDKDGAAVGWEYDAMAEIANDDAIALRVRFNGRVPPPEAMYFRGPVLSNFDGRSWRPSKRLAAMRDAAPRVAGTPLEVEVTLEPLRIPVLPLLELGREAPGASWDIEQLQLRRGAELRGRQGHHHRVEVLQVRRGDVRGIGEMVEIDALGRERLAGKINVVRTPATEPTAAITCDIRPQYRNMRYWLEKDMTPVDLARDAARSLGIEPVSVPIRGGTDGSRLTEMGVPCPNLFTGMQNIHGPLEWVSVQDMQQATQLCLALVERAATPA